MIMINDSYVDRVSPNLKHWCPPSQEGFSMIDSLDPIPFR